MTNQSRAYVAESEVGSFGRWFESGDDIQDYVNAMVLSPQWSPFARRSSGAIQIHVASTRKTRFITANSDSRRIAIPESRLPVAASTVCHEVAHLTNWSDNHDSTWAGQYLYLVRNFIGVYQFAELLSAFDDSEVDYSPVMVRDFVTGDVVMDFRPRKL